MAIDADTARLRRRVRAPALSSVSLIAHALGVTKTIALTRRNPSFSAVEVTRLAVAGSQDACDAKARTLEVSGSVRS